MSGAPIKLRAPTPQEHPYIYAGWIRSCIAFPPARTWKGDDGKIHTAYLDCGWADILKKRIARLLPDTVVATAADAPDALIGFISATPKVVHFCYVEGPFRRRGVAKKMIETVAPEALVYTHWTPCAAAIKHNLEWSEYPLEIRIP